MSSAGWKIYNGIVIGSGVLGGIVGADVGIAEYEQIYLPSVYNIPSITAGIMIPFIRSIQGIGLGTLYGVLAPITIPLSVYHIVSNYKENKRRKSNL